MFDSRPESRRRSRQNAALYNELPVLKQTSSDRESGPRIVTTNQLQAHTVAFSDALRVL